ncbi:primase-helicase zinc-binding domain-containing protein [Aureimonas sp. Leaf324]|uniref:DUF7146 domain-containing protein n=1 Tax=Aureimonas sp. Leaf324 TaxID=1736336 RepID=UPI0006FE0832|nr:primase-helicase zinc-binding domain-containing protein [Aureimonas sp. Leaf324]KQQ81955.1 hypothetical protein ASF65_07835 [Aureimonas sp. Leaf324]
MTGARSPEMDAFVDEARAVSVLQAFERCGYSLRTLRGSGAEYVGPCPSCGGKDRFSLNSTKNVFNCRGAEGGDAIKLVRHLTGDDFLDACELLTGRDRPSRDGGDDAERLRRREEAERRIAEQRERAAREDAEREAEQNHYREREWDRCRTIWREGDFYDCDGPSAKAYLAARGLDVSRLDGSYLRTHPRLGFFAVDAREQKVAIHHGPAMLGLFCRLAGERWEPIGIHQTWIDLEAAPKFRPALRSPVDGETLPSKKMRGSKMGGLIPVLGRLSQAKRMVVGEGIETVLGFACFDGFRADTFYAAAGDLGNLAGKAVQGCRIKHPDLTKVTAAGQTRAVYVPGFEPDMGSAAIPVPERIGELVLLGDGDSEVVMTRAALKRGCARHAREGRTVRALFAPPGGDWADVGAALARESEAA